MAHPEVERDRGRILASFGTESINSGNSPSLQQCRRLFVTLGTADASPLGNPEYGAETFLIEMLVVGQNLGQTFTAHGLHRNTVGEAVVFAPPPAPPAFAVFDRRNRRPEIQSELHRS